MPQTVHFVIPIRHPDQVRDKPQQQKGLSQTLTSLFAQATSDITVRIACNPGQSLPPEAARAKITEINLPPNAALSNATSRAAAYTAIRRDKGQRVAAALRDVAQGDYVMVVDDDDLVHRALAAHVLSAGDRTGHFVRSGYVWPSGAPTMRKVEEFHRLCGTSIVVPAEYYRFVREGMLDTLAIDELGSHRIVAPRPGGPPFAAVPFPGAIYRIEHSNASQIDVVSARGWKGGLAAGLKQLRKHLLPRRRMDLTVIEDFFGGRDPLEHSTLF